MSNFRKLEVWRRAHALVLNVHRAAKKIRGSDYVALRSQMIRGPISWRVSGKRVRASLRASFASP